MQAKSEPVIVVLTDKSELVGVFANKEDAKGSLKYSYHNCDNLVVSEEIVGTVNVSFTNKDNGKVTHTYTVMGREPLQGIHHL